MSNNYWDDEDDDLDFEGQDVSKEKANFNNLRKAKRADEKKIKELTERLEQFERKEREGTIKSVLEQKGVPAKAARLILKDLDDINEESVNNWLNENGDLFGFNPAEAAPAVSSEERQALASQDSLTQGALTPDKAQDLEYRIENAQSLEELQRIVWSESNS